MKRSFNNFLVFGLIMVNLLGVDAKAAKDGNICIMMIAAPCSIMGFTFGPVYNAGGPCPTVMNARYPSTFCPYASPALIATLASAGCSVNGVVCLSCATVCCVAGTVAACRECSDHKSIYDVKDLHHSSGNGLELNAISHAPQNTPQMCVEVATRRMEPRLEPTVFRINPNNEVSQDGIEMCTLSNPEVLENVLSESSHQVVITVEPSSTAGPCEYRITPTVEHLNEIDLSVDGTDLNRRKAD